MVKRAIVYDEASGSIERVLSGDVDPDRESLDDDESLLTDEDADIPRSDLRAKMVDTSTSPPSVVNNPDFSPPPTTSVRRDLISSATRMDIGGAYDDYQTAKSNDDLTTQVDALETMVSDLTHVVTGEPPENL